MCVRRPMPQYIGMKPNMSRGESGRVVSILGLVTKASHSLGGKGSKKCANPNGVSVVNHRSKYHKATWLTSPPSPSSSTGGIRLLALSRGTDLVSSLRILPKELSTETHFSSPVPQSKNIRLGSATGTADYYYMIYVFVYRFVSQ